jgi:two-component system invasion response regulator UvrY
MIKILVVDDHAVVRLGLEILLKDSFGTTTISLAQNFFSALSYIEKDEYDLVILDIIMPGGKSSKMIDSFRQIQPNVKIMVYTALDDKIYAAHYMQAGADAFVSKTNNEKQLIAEINTILLQTSPSALKEGPFAADLLSDISTREHEVLHELIQGKSIKEIANNLRLRVSTISTYKSRLYKKFDVENVIGLLNKISIYKDLTDRKR